MKRPIRLAILMVMTILAIAGFQAYWLYENYKREKSALELRMNMLFRDAVLKVQESKFKLDGHFNNDTLIREINIRPTVQHMPRPGKQVVNMMNMVERKTRDSSVKRQVFVTVDRNSVKMSGDSLPLNDVIWRSNGNGMIRLLYSIDSLQDSIRIREVDSAFSKQLAGNKTVVPFRVSRRLLKPDEQPDFGREEVVVGLKEPIAFSFAMGNSFPYLIKRMVSPIWFSVFLVGFTILSFVLLYRNLLRQRRLTTLKNEFISNVTHELKTPIATVSVAIEALRNFNALNDTRRTNEYLDISQNELQRLSMLVDKVLKLSMFEQQAIQLNKEWFDLAKVAHEVADSMKLQMERAGAKLEFFMPDAEYMINADKLHITSVIYNLLDNALKYSPEKPEIKIELKRYDDYIDMSVSDKGIGIEPAYKQRIFEKFFRVPNFDKHNIKGYGLGLSYVSHIAKMHQGFVEVDTEPGKGSRFSVKIPIEEKEVIHYGRGRVARKIKIG
ncbi:HAMP domain-containing sensor histidine kinase [Pollutibacter soli]|uniref:sensor histidine kinase n=1 Tax=Pollutibacter soli TaxID=3034157 RepID=UPI003013E069